MHEEKCLVIKRENIIQAGYFKDIPQKNGIYCGLKKMNFSEAKSYLDFVEKNKTFKARYGADSAEDDPSWQQIILYQVIRVGNKFYVYQRTKKDEKYPEKRLQGKISVGVGGHIMGDDRNAWDSFYRELGEEVLITKNGRAVYDIRKNSNQYFEIIPVALLKDDTDSVGKVHLGLICEVRVKDKDLKFREQPDSENINGKMVTLAEYKKMVQEGKNPENWTQIVMKELLGN